MAKHRKFTPATGPRRPLLLAGIGVAAAGSVLGIHIGSAPAGGPEPVAAGSGDVAGMLSGASAGHGQPPAGSPQQPASNGKVSIAWVVNTAASTQTSQPSPGVPNTAAGSSSTMLDQDGLDQDGLATIGEPLPGGARFPGSPSTDRTGTGSATMPGGPAAEGNYPALPWGWAEARRSSPGNGVAVTGTAAKRGPLMSMGPTGIKITLFGLSLHIG